MNLHDPHWALFTPRQWQREAFEAARQHLAFSGEPAVIRAIMGSGKSLLLAELCAEADIGSGEVIVVTTPTELLTRQLYQTISKRCEPDRRVGIYFGKAKKLGQIIVCCAPSAVKLAKILKDYQVSLWVADEAHKTECDTLKEAAKALSPVNILGLTATPFRAHESDTLSVFQHQIYEYGADRALADKVVVPWRIETWQGSDTDVNTACLELIAKHGQGPGLTNAINIEDAEAFAAYLSSKGIPAAAVHSRLDDVVVIDALKALQAGRYRCVVHVNMLAEGADFPWLRWLCLRREVGSRVRFAQEIGRALRSCEGKTEAVFLDPNDLFGQFRLTYEEALGEKTTEEAYEEADPAARGNMIKEAKDALAQTFAESEIRRLVVACEAGGMLPTRVILSRAKRTQDSTKIQHAAIGRLVDSIEQIVPDKWYPLIRAIGDRKGCLRRGWASDLICSLRSIEEHGRWPSIDSGGRIAGGVAEAATPITPEKRQRALMFWEQLELPFEEAVS